MRNLRRLDRYRLVDGGRYAGDDTCGAFLIPCRPTGVELMVIASAGGGWDHVSVSLRNRIPIWIEMAFIKRLFFEADEIAMQVHVAEADHIDIHPRTLHLWRPHEGAIPLPPKEYV